MTTVRRRAAVAAALALAGTVLSACGSSTVQTVDASTFASTIRSGATVVDVRTPAEFAAGHIEGAVNIDWEGEDFAGGIEALDKTKTYAVYCHSGARSGQATQAMADAGFTSIYNLNGGITMWQANGFPLVP